MSVTLAPPPRTLGETFSRAYETLAAHLAPLFLPFLVAHIAEALPELGWYRLRTLLGERADQGQLQAAIFGFFAHPRQIALALLAFIVILLVIVAAYTWAFGQVIAALRQDAPNYKGATASLAWFGLVLILPYGIAAAGAGIVAWPLLHGSGWEWSMVLSMLVCFIAALALGVLAQPFFFAGVGAAVQRNTYGLAALRQALDKVRARLGEYIGLAIVLVLVGIGLSLVQRLINKILPSAIAPDLGNLFNGGLSVEAVYKLLFMPDNRPLWATLLSNAVDLGFSALRDAYFTLVVVYWYVTKD